MDRQRSDGMKMTFQLIVKVAFLACISICSAQEQALLDLGPEFDKISSAVKTPAVNWAKNYPGKPVRALVIGHRNCLREAVELMQRMNIEFDAIMSEGKTKDKCEAWSIITVKGHKIPEDNLNRAREKLRKNYDVIVFCLDSLDWEQVPSDIRLSILKKVHDGGSLLFTGKKQNWPESLKLPDSEWRQVPGITKGSCPEEITDSRGRRGNSEFFFRKLGKGNVYKLVLPGYMQEVITSGAPTLAAYEHAMQWGVRCLLKAAAKTPGAKWESIRITGRGNGPKELEMSVSLPVGNAEKTTATVEIADDWNRKVWKKTLPLLKGSGLKVDLPTLPEGKYFCRVFLDRESQRLNFASLPFYVTSKYAIRNLKISDELKHPGAKTKITIDLRRAVKGILTAKVYDREKRLLSSQTFPLNPAKRKQTFDLKLPESRSLVNYLEADLIVGNQVMDRKKIKFGVEQPVDADDFSIGYWGRKGGKGFPENHLQRIKHDYGVDYGMFAILPDGGIKIIDYLSIMPRIVWDQPKKAPPWLYNRDFREKAKETTRKRLTKTGKWPPAVVSLRDEPSYRYTDRSPEAMKDFQEAMKKRYGSLEKLNDSWGSSYKDWKQVERLLISEALEKFSGNPAAGFADRWFNLKATGDFFAFQRKYIQEIIPGLRSGPEGVWSNPEYYSIDYLRLLKEHGFAGLYTDKDTVAPVRSFRNPKLIAGPWFGGYFGQFGHVNLQRGLAWQYLLEGNNCALWFEDFGGMTKPVMFPFTNSGWGLSRATAPVFREIRKIKSGIAKLLLTSRRPDEKIFILYPTNDYRKTFSKWAILLESLGYQVSYVNESGLKGGILEKDHPRMLVLSEALAVSDCMAEKISGYVKRGGILLIDRFAGVYDQFGKPRKKAAFDDLCGIKKRSKFEYVIPKGKFADFKHRLSPFQFNPGNVTQAETSEINLPVFDKTVPSVIVRSVGKGKSVYLNLGVKNAFGSPAKTKKWLKLLMDSLGLTPPVEFTINPPDKLGLQSVTYERGPLKIFAFHHQRTRHTYNRPEEFNRNCQLKVNFPKSAYTYDAYTGKYLGKIKSLATTLPAGRPALLSRLPFHLTGLEVKPEKVSVSPGSTIKFQAVFQDKNGRRPSNYQGVANIQFIDPEGQNVSLLNQNLEYKNGGFQFTWPLALNEKPGTWKIIFTDAATGIKKQTAIKVK